MRCSLMKTLISSVALVSVLVISAGCQNQVSSADQVVKTPKVENSAEQYDNSPVLRPVRYSLKVYSGSSGALLPTNIDTQLAPLLEKFDSWQQVTRITVVGHTDAEGSDKSNMLLSIRRAHALADKLMEVGIPAGVFEVDGRGETAPIASNSSISGKQLNRRVELIAEGLQAIDDSPRLSRN